VKLAKEHQPPDGLRLLLDTALGSCLHFIKEARRPWQRRMLAEAKISPSGWIQGGSKGRASVLLWLDAPTLVREKKAALTRTLLRNS
jgi:hypothetical protein